MYTASCRGRTNIFSRKHRKKTHRKVETTRNWSLFQISHKSRKHENEDKTKVPDFLRPNSSSFHILGTKALCFFVEDYCVAIIFPIHSIKLFIRGFAVVYA